MTAARDYGLPLLLALALHALLGAMLVQGWNPSAAEPRVLQPRIVKAELMVLEATPPKARRTTPPPQPAAPVARRPEPAPRPAPVPRPDREAAQQAERDAQRAKEEAERRERLARLAERAFEQALADEAAALQDNASADAAMSYLHGIYAKVVENWSRPPSARNDMQAELVVELIPTGEVVSVTLLTSSGSPRFDESAERAVRKARRFDVPQDMSLFEARFRRFTLLFKPEDLLR